MNRYFIFVLIAIVFMFSLLLFNRAILVGDMYDEYIPVKYFLKNTFSNLLFPLYSNSIGLGYPIYRDMQAGIYFPLNILLLLPLNIIIIFHIMLLIILIVMAIGYFILFKYMKIEHYKAALAVMCASFGSIVISRIGHFSMLASLMFVPYIILFIKRAQVNRVFEFFAAIFIFFLISGGHPYIVFMALLFILILFINKNNYKSFIRIYTLGILLSSVIIVPLLYQILNSYTTYIQSNANINIKYLLYLIFPLLHISIKPFNAHFINNVNMYENVFYQSLFFIFLIIAFIMDKYKKKVFNKRVLLLFIIFVLSPLFINIGFRQPIRIIQGIFYIMSIYLIIKWDMRFNKKHLIIFNVFIIILSLLLYIRDFPIMGILHTLLVLILFNIAVFIYNKFNLIGKYVFFFIILFDLFFVNACLFNWEDIDNIINKPYTILENKRVLTIIPQNYEVYIDYIKRHNNNFDVESIKSITTFANRGVYYNTYSYNIYNSITFDNYIKYFNDNMILRGGFSNFNFLLSKEQISLDYVFVPKIPVIFNIKDSLKVYFTDSILKEWYIFYTGELKFYFEYSDTFIEDAYLKNINNLKIIKGNVNDSFVVYGNGIIYAIKEEQYIDFVKLFKLANYKTEYDDFFCLMSVPYNRITSYTLVCDLNTGKLIKLSERQVMPMDLIVGIIISLLSLLLSLLYYIKRRY